MLTLPDPFSWFRLNLMVILDHSINRIRPLNKRHPLKSSSLQSPQPIFHQHELVQNTSVLSSARGRVWKLIVLTQRPSRLKRIPNETEMATFCCVFLWDEIVFVFSLHHGYKSQKYMRVKCQSQQLVRVVGRDTITGRPAPDHLHSLTPRKPVNVILR